MKLVHANNSKFFLSENGSQITISRDEFVRTATIDGRAFDINVRGEVLDVWNYTTDNETGVSTRPRADQETTEKIHRALALIGG